MKLIQFREPGPPGVLQCLDVPIPEPKAGEVLIRAHAIGVGIPDTLIRAGMRAVIDMLAAGKLHPRIHAVLPLDEARRAHEMLERGEVLGKLLLRP